LALGAGDGLSTTEQEYNPTPIINEIRGSSKTGAICRTRTNGR
jgi:hypothetical protein